MTFAHGEAQAGGVEGAGTGVMGVLAFEKPQKGFIIQRARREEAGAGFMDRPPAAPQAGC